MHDLARHREVLGMAIPLALLLATAIGAGSLAHAGDGEWTVRLEPLYMQASGNDPHVLTIHELDADGAPEADDARAISLSTDSGLAYRGELLYSRDRWGLGLDFLWFNSKQSVADQAGAAEGPSGTIDEVVFELPGQAFSSTDPSQVLYYRVLEDTEFAMWTADLYARRTLAEGSASGIDVRFGLRCGDFDNDYRAVAGVGDVAGARLDASSNYGLMMGPLVGLSGEYRVGKSELSGHLSQSVIFGDAQLTVGSSQYSGSADAPSIYAVDTFRKDEDVAIPITDLGIRWVYEVSSLLALGVGLDSAVWWDVPVPPGITPGQEGALRENTIVFSGAVATLALTF